MKHKIQLRSKAKLLEPIIRIGKNGLNNSTIDEVRKQLKRKKLIKIKILKSALDKQNRKELAQELAQKTDSEIVELVGFIVVLSKRSLDDR